MEDGHGQLYSAYLCCEVTDLLATPHLDYRFYGWSDGLHCIITPILKKVESDPEVLKNYGPVCNNLYLSTTIGHSHITIVWPTFYVNNGDVT